MSDPIKATNRRWIWKAATLLVLAAAVIVAALLVWQLAHVLLLLFASILVAVLLRSAAMLIEDITPLSGRWSLGIACLLIGAMLVGFVVLMGAQIRTQAIALIDVMPALIDEAGVWFGLDGLGDWLDDRRAEVLKSSDLIANVANYSALIFAVGIEILVVLASGLYLALHPKRYLDGLLMLVDEARHDQARETLEAVGRALRLWLVGQLAAMVMVGTLATLGLWLLEVPNALALGVLAGLLEFVPFVGPFASAVPAVALGLAIGPTTGLWVAGLYVVIQQVEANLITPLIQQRTVDLPPVLTIFAILAFGVLFGPLGVLLASPLAVVCFVLVKKLWVREVLHETVELPGERNSE